MWYLGYVHGGKSQFGGVKVHNEFIVEHALKELEIDCWVGRKIEFKRAGKKRRAEAYESPYLQNYIFAEIPADKFSQAINTNLLAPTVVALTRRDTEALLQFRQRVEEIYSIDARRRANGAVKTEFEPGQALIAVGGQFEAQVMRFKRLVEHAFEHYPKIEAEMAMFGQTVKVQVDPLDVKSV